MKRFILGLAIVGVVIVAVGGASYVVVKYAIDQAGLPVHGGQNAPAPFKYTQLVKMMEASDKPADSDIANLIGCFDKSEMVEGENTALGIHASEVLVQIGQPAVKPLRERLKDKNTKVRYYAVHTLSRIVHDGRTRHERLAGTPQGQRFGHSLQGCLRGYGPGRREGQDRRDYRWAGEEVLDDPDRRRLAARRSSRWRRSALRGCRRCISSSWQRQESGTCSTVAGGWRRLARLPADSALPVLVKLAKDPEESVRQPAMKLLGQLRNSGGCRRSRKLLKKPNPVDMMVLPHAVAKLDAKDAKASAAGAAGSALGGEPLVGRRAGVNGHAQEVRP